MRKSNLFTLFILGLMVVLVLTISFFRERQGTQVALSEEEQIEQKQEPDKDKEPEDEKEPENNNEQTKEEQEGSDQEETQTIIPASLENTLFIGDSRTVDVHIKRLREKVKDQDSWKLSTVWGIGYKFEVK